MLGEEMVSGDGWISDDSSFYGDGEEQERLEYLCDNLNPGPSCGANPKSINVFLSKRRYMLPPRAILVASVPTIPPGDLPRLDRKALEEERLARLGKKNHSASPERPLRSTLMSWTLETATPGLTQETFTPSGSLPHKNRATTPSNIFNDREGCPDSWQLGESVEDFVTRLPPLNTPAIRHEWIWVSNPHRNSQGGSKWPRLDEFKLRGSQLLEDSLQNRHAIQAESEKPKGMITRLLNEEGNLLQQQILTLATDTNVLSGKWMLFPPPEDVTRVWRLVVEAVINDKLGPTAKVAPGEGKSKDRLICVYTKDFRDKADVLRVLQELVSMELVGSGHGIYYKSDPYTYLDIYSNTASMYGLQASLYSSFKMLVEVNFPKAKTSPQKQQANINKFFRSI